jgi:hypothetical protein
MQVHHRRVSEKAHLDLERSLPFRAGSFNHSDRKMHDARCFKTAFPPVFAGRQVEDIG